MTEHVFVGMLDKVNEDIPNPRNSRTIACLRTKMKCILLLFILIMCFAQYGTQLIINLTTEERMIAITEGILRIKQIFTNGNNTVSPSPSN
jgi:hypothetical protein